ncbi:related to PCP1 - mitochondrial serine protease [Pseudozyma flocculosa]|uniref:Related to PCP1 - mitochondrial serine protease n=2 Tax=Pseudozyma flocculosa TaxID=84751 RepID=A0A5C3FEG0_9BASI|nr:related to PCP1 - mitochondrial serine protease [Pseudozyma flocculosa]
MLDVHSRAAPGAGKPSPSALSAGQPTLLSSLGLATFPSFLLNRISRGGSPFRNRPPPSTSSSYGGGGYGGSPRPPRRSSSTPAFLAPLILRINRMPSSYLLNAVIALNALVFLAWMYADSSLRRYSDPRALLFMMKNFACGETNLAEGRWWTLVTSCFSHQMTNHFLLNMVSLFFMAEPVMLVAGNATFLALYLSAGLASATFSLLWHRFADPWFNRGGRGTKGTSLGASGSIYAIMSTFACIQPRATFLLFFVVPVPAWLCVSGIFAYDLYQAAITPGGQVDGAGHVGGILSGLLFWRFGLRGFRM